MALHCLTVSLGEVVSGAEAHQCMDPGMLTCICVHVFNFKHGCVSIFCGMYLHVLTKLTILKNTHIDKAHNT